MIRKWIEKKIEARVNEYLATLEVDEEAIAEHVEVDLELVAEHIEASDLVDYIDLDEALEDALDYDQVADYVDMHNLADHICKYDLASEIDKYEIAEAMDKDDIASALDPCPSDIAAHIELQDLADYVADEPALLQGVIENNDFMDNLADRICGPVEERVLRHIVEVSHEATNFNTDRINALVEAMEAIELAITNMRLTMEGDGDE